MGTAIFVLQITDTKTHLLQNNYRSFRVADTNMSKSHSLILSAEQDIRV